MKGTMKRGICLVLVVCMLLVLVPGVALASEAAFRTEPMVAANGGLSVALRADGTVFDWGWFSESDLYSETPAQVQNLSNVTEIATSSAHVLALRADGTVWTWGPAFHDQPGVDRVLNLPPSWYNLPREVVQALFREAYNTPMQIPNLNNITAVAAGDLHSAVLRDDGTVWTWGNNFFGQLGDGTTQDRTTPVQVQNLSNITAIAIGGDYTLALRSDGTIWGWGDNHFNQLGSGTGAWELTRTTPAQIQTLTDVTAIAASHSHALALRSDGTVWAWGDNHFGQLGDGTTTNRGIPAQVQSLNNVTAISAGGWSNVALRADGTVWGWGDNSNGQLGDGTSGEVDGVWQVHYSTTPVQTQNLGNVTAVAAGGDHTVALRADGTVWAWGSNGLYQLGIGFHGIFHYPTPVQVLGPNGVGFLNLNPTTAPHPTFPDVLATHWGFPFVEQAYTRGFMRGVTGGRFDPYGSLTRAQVAQIMVNMADVGTQPHPAIAPFSDVPAHAWYAPVIAWAAEQEIMNGHADGTFGPGQPITREQFAVVMRNFAAWQGYDVTSPPGGGTEWPFPDNGSISWWAADALRWANYHGIILGSGGNVLPTATSMRVQAATIVVRFDDTEFQQAPQTP
ncbi:MAG: S-layer homology domain-containing protein [Oscillospiraceae bacterium]|nr:S-layer homology domain-containing protein [Oscillospiraceae bacterium]